MDGMFLPILIAVITVLVAMTLWQVTRALTDPDKRKLKERLSTEGPRVSGQGNQPLSITVQQEATGLSGKLSKLGQLTHAGRGSADVAEAERAGYPGGLSRGELEAGHRSLQKNRSSLEVTLAPRLVEGPLGHQAAQGGDSVVDRGGIAVATESSPLRPRQVRKPARKCADTLGQQLQLPGATLDPLYVGLRQPS